MLRSKIFKVTLAVLVLTAVFYEAQAHRSMKKLMIASVIAKALKPRFVPLPIPIPFKLKINKGERVEPYQMDSYGGGMGGYGGGMGGGHGGGMGGMGGLLGGLGGGKIQIESFGGMGGFGGGMGGFGGGKGGFGGGMGGFGGGGGGY
ncbi:hypothetical protein JTE90_004778 [Oedothorax gibbosus]|uniref:Glycine-rich protein n=1 Tax=Oedothorax gibbosus TaxID=931172 RepID=A0AAV6VGW7_9ARAC|nr:hypothetical protein JTE90_004778 [Oedothorax gibbosus]